MNILIFMCVLFAVWTLNFLLGQFVQQHFFSKKAKNRIQILLLMLFIVMVLTVSINETVFWLINLVFLIGFVVCYQILIISREKKFKDNFCHHVDRLVLEMKSGSSFRSSFESIIAQSNLFEQEKLIKILEMIRFKTFQKEKDQFIYRVVSELTQVDIHAHNAIQRLNVLRLRLRTESEFRYKVRQAARQTQAQATIMTILYFATLVFVMKTSSESIKQTELALSLTLFSVGTLVIFFYGRNYKWKI